LIASINRSYFADLFITIINSRDDPTKTATEIAAIQGEKLLMLGPVLEKVFSALRQLVERTYSIMLRNNMVDEPPQDIAGREIKVEFISTLAQAQRAVGIVSIERFVGFVGNLAAVHQNVLDIPDWDQTVEQYGALLNLDPNLITDKDLREEVRAARARQAQMAQSAEIGKTGAEAAKLLSETDVDGEPVLQRLLSGAGAGVPG
jgi:hypothetical protein